MVFDAKHACLSDLGRTSFVSQRGLATLLNTIQKEGIPPHFSRATQFRHRQKRCYEMTPYGRVIVRETLVTRKGPVRVGIQNPMAMLHKLTSSCDGFQELMRHAVAQHGTDNPWGIVLYNDGITPQDSSSKHDKRKLIAFYWSFREFGPRGLAMEEAWMTLALIRTSTLEQYEGGICRFTRECLDKHFFCANGNNFKTTGMFLPSVPANGPLRAVIWTFLGDEPALKDFFECKGHAGFKPCLLCSNVVLLTFHSAALGPEFVSHDCESDDLIQLHTDASILAVYEKLGTDRAMANYGELVIASGFNYVERGLILHPDVRVASMTMFDWPHVMCAGGLLDHELGMCMKTLHTLRAPTTYATLGEFVKMFTWPKRHKFNIDKLFDAAATKSHLTATSWGSTVSELLSLTPVLSLYFVAVGIPQGHAKEAVTSLVACLDCVELLQVVKTGLVQPEDLKTAFDSHYKLFLIAYERACVKPKHHYARHLWRILKDQKMLLSCLVLERFHRVAKAYARVRHNTTSHDVCLLEELTVTKLMDCKRNFLHMGLVNAAKPRGNIANLLKDMFHDDFDSIRISSTLATSRGTIAVNDVVFLRIDGQLQCGEVILHFTRSTETLAVVSLWVQVPTLFTFGHTRRYDVVDNPQIVASTCLEEPLIYSRSDGAVTVLLPPLYR